MNRVSVDVAEFNLTRTLESGQVFHWTPEGSGWRGLIDHTDVYVEQNGIAISCDASHLEVVSRYFSFDHPLKQIYKSFPDHDFMRAALLSCRGIRIIRQPHWECLATFITSPMKQVTHIRQMSLAIRKRYGNPVEGSAINAYPTSKQLARADEQALRECGLGFRAKSLFKASQMVAEGKLDLEKIAALPTEEARETLCGIPGVGKKVANCVLLFAYERLDAVPIDVWIARVLKELFQKKNQKLTPRQMEEYSQTRLGIYAGYAQQYLFHHARAVKTGRG
ncbi:MAG: DNA glycosylase [Chthoniobacterales bacterium]